jgi:hypothetical protein
LFAYGIFLSPPGIRKAFQIADKVIEFLPNYPAVRKNSDQPTPHPDQPVNFKHQTTSFSYSIRINPMISSTKRPHFLTFASQNQTQWNIA